MALAESIHQLSSTSRRMRTCMWSSLQSTVHFASDPGLAGGDKSLNDDSLIKGKQEDDAGDADAEEETGGNMVAKEEDAVQVSEDKKMVLMEQLQEQQQLQNNNNNKGIEVKQLISALPIGAF